MNHLLPWLPHRGVGRATRPWDGCVVMKLLVDKDADRTAKNKLGPPTLGWPR